MTTSANYLLTVLLVSVTGMAGFRAVGAAGERSIAGDDKAAPHVMVTSAQAGIGGALAHAGEFVRGTAHVARDLVALPEDRLLVRFPGGANQLDDAYRAAHAQVRGDFHRFLSAQQPVTADSLARELKAEHAVVARTYRGEGAIAVNPGQFHQAQLLRSGRSGFRSLDVRRTLREAGLSPEEIAQEVKFGPVAVRDVPAAHLPANTTEGHFYPGAQSHPYYLDAAAKRLQTIRQLTPGSVASVHELADYFHTVANARVFGQVNNSLWMDHVNAVLLSSGHPGISHGLLDHAALTLASRVFRRVFEATIQGKISWR